MGGKGSFHLLKKKVPVGVYKRHCTQQSYTEHPLSFRLLIFNVKLRLNGSFLSNFLKRSWFWMNAAAAASNEAKPNDYNTIGTK